MKKTAKRLYLVLGVLTLLAVGLSLTSNIGFRGFRIIAILGIYLVGIVLLIADRTWRALLVWCVLGLGTGGLYCGYEAWSAKSSSTDNASAQPEGVSLINLPMGLIAWPFMLPDVTEYWLADAGILGGKARRNREE